MRVNHTYCEGSESHAHSSKAVKNQRNKDEYGKFWKKNTQLLSVYFTLNNISNYCSDDGQISNSYTLGVAGSIGD